MIHVTKLKFRYFFGFVLILYSLIIFIVSITKFVVAMASHNVPRNGYMFLGSKQKRDRQRPNLIKLYSNNACNYSNTSV